MTAVISAGLAHALGSTLGGSFEPRTPPADGSDAIVVNPYALAPFIVVWETTRACALACVHCRAEANPRRDARELATDEARRLIDAVRRFGDPPPLLVFTGDARRLPWRARLPPPHPEDRGACACARLAASDQHHGMSSHSR